MGFWNGVQCLDLELGVDSLTMTPFIFEELLILSQVSQLLLYR